MSEITRLEVELVVWSTCSRADEPVPVDEIAAEAGVPVPIAREMLALGLAEPAAPAGPDPLWPRAAAIEVARAVRLARDLGLNAQGAVLALELLERIAELERRLGPPGPEPEG